MDKLLVERLADLVVELKADYNRIGGRWGIHGHYAVDDDYFTALGYVINRLNELLAEEDFDVDRK